MIFQRLNRTDPEKIFMMVKNVEGATLTTGRAVSLVNTSTDGINAVMANAAADYVGFIGVAKSDIINNDYGLVQTAGVVNSIYFSNAGTSVTVTINDCLIPGPNGGFFSAAAPTYANSGFKCMFAIDMGTLGAISAAGYGRGLLKMF